MVEGKNKKEKSNGSEALLGMKEICDYIRRSEATVLKMIRDYGFPARKIEERWVSDRRLIDRWLRGEIGKAAM